jgi:hypothetical protein
MGMCDNGRAGPDGSDGPDPISSYILQSLRADAASASAASAAAAAADFDEGGKETAGTVDRPIAGNWDGYGAGAGAGQCIRYDVCTRPRARKQLPSRVFHAAPDLSHGGALDPELAEVEARAWQGESTGGCAPCPGSGGGKGRKKTGAGSGAGSVGKRAALAGTPQTNDRFDPILRQTGLDVRHIVPVWTAGGASSRDIARSPCFRQLIASGAANASTHDFDANDAAWERTVSLAAGLRTPTVPSM